MGGGEREGWEGRGGEEWRVYSLTYYQFLASELPTIRISFIFKIILSGCIR